MMKNCTRCHRRPSAPERARCQKCLDYSKNWQKTQTEVRLQNKLCITCGAPAAASRCNDCTENKSRSYFETRYDLELYLAS